MRSPDLPAQLVCAAGVKATEAIKSALDRLGKGRKGGVPPSKVCPIRYDQRSYWVKWERMTSRVATITGRVQLAFTVPHLLSGLSAATSVLLTCAIARDAFPSTSWFPFLILLSRHLLK